MNMSKRRLLPDRLVNELLDMKRSLGKVDCTMIDVSLLDKTLRFITDNPEEHDQEVYARNTPCGTKGCIAHWLCVFSGHKVRLSPGVFSSEWAVVETGESVCDVAIREAGLTFSQAEALFWYANTIDDLWSLASEFTNGEITRML